MLVGVDVGGTFTDAVLIDGSAIHTAKAPTTPRRETEGVIAAIEAVCRRAGAEPAEISYLSHGMTVGTNALLERRGAKTVLLATEGHTDVLETARQDRASLYRLCEDRPPPLSDPELAIAVAERSTPDGVVLKPSEIEINRVVEALADSGAEAAALCLLHSFSEDSNERLLAEAVRSRLPELSLSVSSELLPRHREYERASTTVIDAYLAPLLSGYLGELAASCAERGLPEPVLMQSSGGVAALAEVSGRGAWSVLSGPAGGAVGAAKMATEAGSTRAVGFDMGGTSCDVCLIEDGGVKRTASRELAGRPIQLTTVDVHTVGAGGGSIAWVDAGGALRVGPRSAGARPGPACYGHGGEEPTVTDANLLLGRLPKAASLGGEINLDPDAAERAIAPLASQLGLEPMAAAAGVIEVANQEMLRALRVITVERGVDPRELDLVAFGGAGGLHAAELARELGAKAVLIPRGAGVLSALGLALSERRADLAKTLMVAGEDLTDERLTEEIGRLVEQASTRIPEVAEVEVIAELRYRGQSFELDIDARVDSRATQLREDFARAHAQRYGYRDEGGEVELAALRVAAIGPAQELQLRPPSGGSVESTRKVQLPDGERETRIISGQPTDAIGELAGPCLVELEETTIFIPGDCRGLVDDTGGIMVEIGDPS